MNGRERVRKALRREETDRPPIDLGSTPVTGIAASTYYRVRKALGLEERSADLLGTGTADGLGRHFPRPARCG